MPIVLPKFVGIWEVNRRQLQSLLQRCDIYKPLAPAADPVTREGSDLKYPSEPTYVNVPCQFHTTPVSDQPEMMGRTKIVNIFTLDKLRMTPEIEVFDTWGIVTRDPTILFSTERDAGLAFFVVQGNSKIRANYGRRRANNQSIQIKRSPAPPEIL